MKLNFLADLKDIWNRMDQKHRNYVKRIIFMFGVVNLIILATGFLRMAGLI